MQAHCKHGSMSIIMVIPPVQDPTKGDSRTRARSSSPDALATSFQECKSLQAGTQGNRSTFSTSWDTQSKTHDTN